MNRIVHVLIGDLPTVADVAIKTSALFLTAAILFRFTERRTLAELAPFDWIAAVAAGAIVGRAATATDTAWLQATTALLCLLAAHAVLARLRLIPALCRFIDPPLVVLISDGEVNRRNLRRCGLTAADLAADRYGWNLEVVDLRSLNPLDFDTVAASVRKTGRAVVIHEGPRTLGFGAELAARIQEELFYDLESPVLRATGFDTPYPPARLEKLWLPGVDRLLDCVEKAMNS